MNFGRCGDGPATEKGVGNIMHTLSKPPAGSVSIFPNKVICYLGMKSGLFMDSRLSKPLEPEKITHILQHSCLLHVDRHALPQRFVMKQD